MAEAVSGTVMNILHDGSNGQPMRVMIQWSKSRGFMQGRGLKSAYVTFNKPQDIKPGDDLHLVARKRPSHGMFQPDQYIVDEDVPVQMRLKHQLQDGAQIKSFGQKIAANGQRPGWIAATKSLALGVFGVKPGSESHCVVLRPATSCDNEALNWATGLLDGVPQHGPTFVIEPEEFALRQPTAKEQEELKNSPRRAEKRIQKLMNQELFERLRPSLPQMLDDKWVHSLVAQRRSAGINQTVGPAQGQHAHSAGVSVIKPYNPYASGHSFYTGLTGLSSFVFVPKVTLDAKWRHAFTTAHELAHSIDEEFGIRGGQGAADVLKRENFADAFALMAMVQRDGNLDNANVLAAYRSMLVVAGGGLDHWTGPVACEAVRRAGELMQAGKLKSMSGVDLAHEAARLTKRLSFTEQQLGDLVGRRAQVFRRYKLPLKTDKKDGITYVSRIDGGRGAVTAIANALRDAPDSLGQWQPIFKAGIEMVQNLTITPKQLEDDPQKQVEAVRLYRKDIRNSLEGLTNRRPIHVINLHVAEQQRLNVAKAGHFGPMAERLAEGMTLSAPDLIKMAPINMTPAPDHEAARIVRSGVGPGSDWLQQAFSKTPQQRIERLVRIMDHEATCWQAFNRDKNNPTLADQTRRAVLERRALCFAVEQDDEAMKLVNRMKAGPFREAVVEGSENESLGVWSTLDERKLSRAARSGATGLNKLSR
ncbi:MAG: hypothetical protein Alpg2KO_06610 [Alphaproteobacteria bacterium]